MAGALSRRRRFQEYLRQMYIDKEALSYTQEAHRWRTGRGHPRIDTLGQRPAVGDGSTGGAIFQPETQQSPSAIPCFPFSSSSVQSRPKNVSLLQPGDVRLSSDGIGCGRGGCERPQTSCTAPPQSRVTAALGPAVYPFPSSAAAAAGGPEHGRRFLSGRPTGGGRTRPTTTTGFNPRLSQQPTLPPHAWVPAGAGSSSSTIGAATGSPSRTGTAPTTASASVRNVGTVGGKSNVNGRGKREGGGEGGGQRQSTRAGRAAAKRRQDQVGKRLADATAAAPDPAGFERSEFLCADGITSMPYAVVGQGAPLLPASGATASRDFEEEERRTQAGSGGGVEMEGEFRQEGTTSKGGVLSFVVVHDFFDTLEKTFLLFKPLVLKYPGCQVLCFNSPGQVGTRLPPEPEGLLSNTWVADRLDELMQVKRTAAIGKGRRKCDSHFDWKHILPSS